MNSHYRVKARGRIKNLFFVPAIKLHELQPHVEEQDVHINLWGGQVLLYHDKQLLEHEAL